MTSTKHAEKTPLFVCEKCDFICSKRSDYDRHTDTIKHKRLAETSKKTPKIHFKTFNCICGSKYFHSSSLAKHKRTCIVVSTSVSSPLEENKVINVSIEDVVCSDNKDTITKSMFMELINDNKEMIKIIKEQQEQIKKQQEQIITIIPKIGNTTNNTTNNNNNTTNNFNLNVFLNEQCKDAINMSEFIENMELDLEDLTETGRLGYVGGISRILINKLQELDIYKRPLHCTDMKRETLYIKNNDEWTKENNSKDALNGLVNKVSNRNCRNIKQWTDEHPDYQVFDSPENMDYVRLTQAVLGGLGEQECKQFKDKIIRNVIKEVMVNKF